MVVVEGRMLLCWACKQLGHIGRICPQKAGTIRNTAKTTSTRTTKSISLTAAQEPEVHLHNREKGWTLIYRKRSKLCSHISSYKINRRNNCSDNKSNNRNYYSLGNNSWLHNQSTFITTTHPKAKRKKKKDHRGRTVLADLTSVNVKKKSEWRNTSKKNYGLSPSPDRKTRKNKREKLKKKSRKKKLSKIPFFSVDSPTTLFWKRKTRPPPNNLNLL